MKFSCSTSDLLQALQLVSRAISSQQALPILGNVLLEAEGKRCTVSATDLELSIITSFEADIENEGSITIPAKAIVNFAQYTSDAEVLLETSEGTQLKCTSKHSKTLLSGESATEYPTITPVEKRNTFSLDAEPLLKALQLVTFTSAKSSLRPVLSGVYLRTEKGKLILVATDSYRLSEYSLPIDVQGEEIACIIPVKVLEELRSVLGASKGEAPPTPTTESSDAKDKKKAKMPKVEVTMNSQQIELHIGHTRLLSRLIEGKFPDYNQIIPKGAMTTVLVPLRELTTAVKRMHYFAKEVNNNLTFSFTAAEVHISTPQTQMGRDEASLSAEVRGNPVKIALSSSYLLDFLAHSESDNITMEILDSFHPALLRLPGSDRFLHLIMPLRMQEETIEHAPAKPARAYVPA